jgi:hypothetical protein
MKAFEVYKNLPHPGNAITNGWLDREGHQFSYEEIVELRDTPQSFGDQDIYYFTEFARKIIDTYLKKRLIEIWTEL